LVTMWFWFSIGNFFKLSPKIGLKSYF